MKFKTRISATKNGAHYIRGHRLGTLIKSRSFVDVVFLLLRGAFPKKNEARLFEAALVAMAEHGIEPPSIFVPRVVASTGNAFHVALAAGCLAIGTKHGGAIEAAANVFRSPKSPSKIVEEYAARREPLPGFGHRLYTTEDPRVRVLFEYARTLGFSCRFFKKAYTIQAELRKMKQKMIPLNIDGAVAAILLELKFDPRLGEAVFLMARIAGMSAHVLEEYDQANRYYRLGEEDIGE